MKFLSFILNNTFSIRQDIHKLENITFQLTVIVPQLTPKSPFYFLAACASPSLKVRT